MMIKFTKKPTIKTFLVSTLLLVYVVAVVFEVIDLRQYNVKEVTVEAEIDEIFSVGTHWKSSAEYEFIYKYSYKGTEYKKKGEGWKSCNKGDKFYIVIDSDHPDVVINKTKVFKISELIVTIGLAMVTIIALLIVYCKKRTVRGRKRNIKQHQIKYFWR